MLFNLPVPPTDTSGNQRQGYVGDAIKAVGRGQSPSSQSSVGSVKEKQMGLEKQMENILNKNPPKRSVTII